MLLSSELNKTRKSTDRITETPRGFWLLNQIKSNMVYRLTSWRWSSETFIRYFCGKSTSALQEENQSFCSLGAICAPCHQARSNPIWYCPHVPQCSFTLGEKLVNFNDDSSPFIIYSNSFQSVCQCLFLGRSQMVNFKLNNIFFPTQWKKPKQLLSMGFIKPWKNDTKTVVTKFGLDPIIRLDEVFFLWEGAKLKFRPVLCRNAIFKWNLIFDATIMSMCFCVFKEYQWKKWGK